MKICTIVGARPQFIKAATVARVIAAQSGINDVLIHTGQHYDRNMSACFFEELSIPKPAYSLNIGSGRHGLQTGKMLKAIETVLLKENPDWVLVYGDTNSTLAGSLAAAKLAIPLAHVEAGLRSFNRKMPEEINRIVSDQLSDLLFTPTEYARRQLLSEGISEDKIRPVGDVMYDATLFYNQQTVLQSGLLRSITARKPLGWPATSNNALKSPSSTLRAPSPRIRGEGNKEGSYLEGDASHFILVTIHRAENTDDLTRLKHICDALLELGTVCRVILPLHPRTRAALSQMAYLTKLEAVLTVIEPIGYLDMLAFERQAALIVTDSGGVQKEAYFNQVPCVTLRDETEWRELVETGWNQLCSPAKPFSLIPYLESSNKPADQSTRGLYGDGCAAQKIVAALMDKMHA